MTAQVSAPFDQASAAPVGVAPSRIDRSTGIIRVLRDARRAIGPNRRGLVLLCLCSMAAGGLESGVLFLVARLAVGASTGSGDLIIAIGPISTGPLTIQTVVALAGALLVAWIVMGYPVARLSSHLSSSTLVRYRRELVDAYLSSPWSEVSKDREGRFQELAGDYCYRTERLVQVGNLIIVCALNIIVLLAVAVMIAPIGALAAIVVLGLLGLVLRPIAKRVRSGTVDFSRANRQFNGRAAQTARVAQEIASFEVRSSVARWLDPDIEAAGAAIERMRFSMVYLPMLYQFGALAFVIGLAGAISLADPTNVVVLAPVLLLLIRVLGYGRQMQNSIQAGVELTPYIDGLTEEIERLLASHTPPRTRSVDLATPLVFNDVSFAYLAGQDVLAGVDVTIEAGDTIGVVGPSGGGKSTFTQLLLNLRSPSTGAVTAAGIALDTIDPACWSRLVALVPQDNKLVHASVGDNVRFFRPWITDDQVRAAVRAAHLDDEIMALPDGYATMVGPGARELSGGQRQRLGIARGLVGRPSLLILDEPTSALDSRSEQLIRQTLEELARTVTLVVVAHRPATLEVCKRLFVVEGGRLVESDPSDYHGSIE